MATETVECDHSHEWTYDRPCTDETYTPQQLGHAFRPDANAVKFSKIVFLGTGSAIPSPGRRNTSGIAVLLNNASTILLDCGEATQHQLMKCASIKFNTISTILITHLHGDHCFGLFGLLCTVASQGRTAPVVLVGPKGLRQMVVTVLTCSGGFGGFELQFLELEHGQTHADLGLISAGVHLAAYPLKHRVASFGYVLREGLKPGALDATEAKQLGASGKQLSALKNGLDVTLDDGRIVRSADCVGAPAPARKIALLQDTYDSSIALPALQDVDLLIHECTYSAGMRTKALAHGHSTSAMVGEYGAQCRAKMIAMTHFSNRYETREQTRINEKRRQEALKAAGGASAESQLQTLAVTAASSSASAAAPAPALSPTDSTVDPAVESDVLTLDELCAEATAAYLAASNGVTPVGGIHAAEDFTVIESVKDEFKVASKKDRVPMAEYEITAANAAPGAAQPVAAKAPKPAKNAPNASAVPPPASVASEAAASATTSTPML